MIQFQFNWRFQFPFFRNGDLDGGGPVFVASGRSQPIFAGGQIRFEGIG